MALSADFKVRGILLAAGSSSRFGSNKLLQVLVDGVNAGTPVAVAAARNLAAALPHPLAVVRPGPDIAELHAALAAAGCEVVVCAEAHEGMGASLACAVRASSDAAGWLVALADMPFIRPETIAEVASWVGNGAAVAAPSYRGRRGHPVCFSYYQREELLALRGDEGARKVFDRHGGLGNLVRVNDPGILRDIDVPGDLLREA